VKKLRHAVQYGLYLMLRTKVRVLPHAASRPLGRLAGRCVFRAAGGMRRTARENLDAALPELTAEKRRWIWHECFRQLGASVFETLSARRFSPTELARRAEVVGWEHYEAAHARGHGAFLLGAHLGPFEVGAHLLAMRATPTHVVSDRMSNPHFDRELVRLRDGFGIETISEVGAARGMFRVLSGGGTVFIALDLRTRYEDAIVVRFFGRTSLTSPIPAFIALKRQVPVVPTFSYLTPTGYRVELEPAIEPHGSGKRGIAEMTQRYLAAIERRIRRDPELWVWHYRRWRPEWDDPAKVGSPFALRTGDEESAGADVFAPAPPTG